MWIRRSRSRSCWRMLEHGKAWRLSTRVQRIVAPNPGAMTGPGTNTYLLGEDELIVLDPGPAIDSHVQAILDAAAGRIRYIVCTHTHPDHSPAWQALAEATGATVLGALPAGDDHQDETFAPDVELEHEFCLVTPELSLTALATPGHVSNHYCFLLEEERMLFAGDHIMNGSTVVIIPPGGDMQAYIASLRLLLDYPLDVIAPGHGELIYESRQEIEHLIAHRLGREAKVLAGLAQVGPCDLDRLVTVVYDDVDPVLHPWAKRSLEAHLIKLDTEGRARCGVAQRWQLAR
ncbi:MAG: glyoxylase-like metal-dependent hydrolase (beta-lactamase superfamily II) [Halieaceae bacterium]|jgi:glyoxylase-like metal-dependent hydrolase (beta-lactamase superfamily II)